METAFSRRLNQLRQARMTPVVMEETITQTPTQTQANVMVESMKPRSLADVEHKVFENQLNDGINQGTKHMQEVAQQVQQALTSGQITQEQAEQILDEQAEKFAQEAHQDYKALSLEQRAAQDAARYNMDADKVNNIYEQSR